MRRARDHHEFGGKAAPTESSSDRSFGVVFAGFFAIVASYNWWYGGAAWPFHFGIGSVFLAVALLRPNVLSPLNRLWIKLGVLMAIIMSPIVLGLLFFLVVTPVGLLMRATGIDPLRLRQDPRVGSYWIVRHPPGPPGESMGDQF
jgi:Saxitoxin biosynthesis operon protein SxtJ